jgi:hypothetical protein
MEEVIGSIPIRSTKQPSQNQPLTLKWLPQAYPDLVSIVVDFRFT